MSRTPLVAGNWKMHTTVAEAEALAQEMLPGLDEMAGIDKVVCPPYISLTSVARVIAGSTVSLGAQNMFWEESGAYTGEISPAMLHSLCTYVILGHSERRQHFGETDASVNRRLRAACEHGLHPILCVGETLEERNADETRAVVVRQLRGGLDGLRALVNEDLVVAYEPVWAIGTGEAATPDDARAVIAGAIRPELGRLLDPSIAAQVRVLYGGSVNAGNAESFFVEEEVDGALVGGASLDADAFTAIARAAAFS